MAFLQPGSDAGSEAATLLSAGEDLGAAPDLNAVLRVMAETQRELLRMQRDGGGPRKSRLLLLQVKLPDFDGNERTSTKRYREWKKSLDIIPEPQSAHRSRARATHLQPGDRQSEELDRDHGA